MKKLFTFLICLLPIIASANTLPALEFAMLYKLFYNTAPYQKTITHDVNIIAADSTDAQTQGDAITDNETNPTEIQLISFLNITGEENITALYVDGTTYSSGDYCIEGKKIYVCNTTGTQTGTWADNAALWDELGQGSHPSDRIVSADGASHGIVSNGVFDVTRSGNLVIACNSINTAIKAPTTPSTKMAVTNTDAHIDYVGIPRVVITDAHSKFIAKNESTYLIIKNTKIEYKFKGDIRQLMDTGASYIKSPDLLNNITINDTKTKIVQNGSERVLVDAVGSALLSPDGFQTILVTDTNATYNSSEILTVADKGVINGLAELDGSGIVPETQLPSYVDEVVEGYLDVGDTKENGYDAFYVEIGLTTKITEFTGKIYVDLNTSTAYRWTTTVFTMIGTGLVLGESLTNAYRGDRGKIAYDHSQVPYDSYVSGPASSIDYRIPTFDGVTGKLLRQSIVSISASGIMLGVTDFTVDNIHINENLIEAIGMNQSLQLKGSGIGATILGDLVQVSNGGVVSGVTQLNIDDLRLDGNVISSTLTNADINITPNGTGNVILTESQLYFKKSGGKGYVAWYDTDGGDTRMGWMGFGSGGNYDWTIRNETAGGVIQVQPDNGSGIGTFLSNAYTKLGGSAPAIKMKKLTGTMGATEGASVNIAHGLTGVKILDISVMVESSTNYAMPSKFTNNVGFQFEYYANGTNIVIINHASGSEFVMGKPFRALITYEE